MRRVVVTPTFAVGLGVVVAAVFAYQMGAPSFRVTAPEWGGQRCTTPGCAASQQHGGPASVKGGQPLSGPGQPAPAGTPSAQPTARGGAGHAATRPAVTYRTQNSWPGGFEGYLTVWFTHGYVPRHWGLRFSYPSGRIQRVWGLARWQPKGAHTALVTAPGWRGSSGAQEIQVWFEVNGHAGPPRDCTFDRAPCDFH